MAQIDTGFNSALSTEFYPLRAGTPESYKSGMSEFDPDSLAGRIERRLKSLGLKAAKASRDATGKEDAIRKIFQAARDGAAFNPRMDTLQGLARVLGTTTDWLTAGVGGESINSVDGATGEIPLLGRRVPYGGTVRAGGFLPVDEYFTQDDGDHLVPSSVIWHPDFPDVKQHAWLVHGDSLDLVGIREGMWVVAALYSDYLEKVGEVDNGQFVVVERSRHGGSEIERTIKEAQFNRAGMRLIPRSSNPVHKELFIPINREADSDTETVRVLAVVLSAVTDYSRRIRAAIAQDMPSGPGPGKKARSRMANA